MEVRVREVDVKGKTELEISGGDIVRADWQGDPPTAGRIYHVELDSDDIFILGQNAVCAKGDTEEQHCLIESEFGLIITGIVSSIPIANVARVDFGFAELELETQGAGFVAGKFYTFILRGLKAYDVNV